MGLVTLWLVAFLGCYGDAFVGVSGFVVDPLGNPVAGVTVTLSVAPESGYRELPDSRPTDVSGRFANLLSFSALDMPKDFVVHFEKAGYSSKDIPISSHGATGLVVTLLPSKVGDSDISDSNEPRRRADPRQQRTNPTPD